VDLQILKLINTFGFFVALAFLAAARTMASELERKHGLGLLESTRRPYEPPRPTTPLDLLISGLLAFVVGYKILGIMFAGETLQGGSDTQRYLLSTRGHLGAGIITGLAWMAFRYREIKASRTLQAEPVNEPEFVEVTPRDHTMGITGAAALGGLIGAKLFHFLERPRSIVEFFEHPSLSALFSGLTIYGGLILGTLFVYLYCRRHKLTFVHVADSVAPGLMLAYGIGRLGCHFSGDGDWGIPSTSPPPAALSWLPQWFWSYDYPNNVINSGVHMAGGYQGYSTHLVPPVYPTPLYESLAAFAIFAVLWNLRKHITRPLVLFGVYMMLNGFERFWIEKIRVNATYELFGRAMTQAEIIAVLMFVGGAVLIVVQRRAAPPVPAAAPTAAAPPARE
jgi:prolipoprotein diacylglyceryl transferase